jgi:hypothetical protein
MLGHTLRFAGVIFVKFTFASDVLSPFTQSPQ